MKPAPSLRDRCGASALRGSVRTVPRFVAGVHPPAPHGLEEQRAAAHDQQKDLDAKDSE
jgi:hypothetical protein